MTGADRRRLRGRPRGRLRGLAGVQAGDDAGSGTVWMLAALAVLGALTLTVAVTGEVALARHRTAAVADLAALAAAAARARGDPAPCARASRVAHAGGAQLAACHELADGSVAVAVSGPVGPLLGRLLPSTRGPLILARAGPAGGPDVVGAGG